MMDAIIDRLVRELASHADMGHLGLALTVAVALWHNRYLQAELKLANERFDDFVRELAAFNDRSHR